jgi:hypothetical protein
VVSADGTTFEAGRVAGGEPYPFFFTQTHDYNNEQWPIVPALKPHAFRDHRTTSARGRLLDRVVQGVLLLAP